MRSNWSAIRRACFSLAVVATTKCGLRTSIQFSTLSRAVATVAKSTNSGRNLRCMAERPQCGWRHYKSEWARANTYSGTSVTAAVPSQPVLAHQFMGPCRLLHFSARQELPQHGLDIEDRCSVDGIEFRDEEF